jgi:hydroxyacylglutathione hydrolase
MSPDIKTITRDGTNCYLVKTGSGYFLIDTNFPFQRSNLETELEQAGCQPGNLKLIVITHGDIDHTGNCAYLRDKYQVKIAMHEGDTEMCLKDGRTRDRGKMPQNFPMPLMVLWLMKGILRFAFRQATWRKPFDTFKPDIFLEDGQNLSEYGFDAEILYTPGHSIGSISILTESGDLFCGDMFNHVWGRIIISTEEGVLEKIKKLEIKTIYPGHGEPFPMATLTKS